MHDAIAILEHMPQNVNGQTSRLRHSNERLYFIHETFDEKCVEHVLTKNVTNGNFPTNGP